MKAVCEDLAPLFLQASVMAGVLAAIVWVICRCSRKWIGPELAIVLWTIVILRLLVVSGPASQFSLLNVLSGKPKSIQCQPVQTASVQTSLVIERPIKSSLTTSIPRLASIASWRMNLWSWGVGVWLSISACCLIRLFVSAYRSCLKSVRETQGVPVKLRLLYADCLKALGIRPTKAPTLLISAMVSVPAISGLWKFRITLPKWSLSELGEEQLRLVLLHELIHFQRRDVWRQWLYCLVASLHWFNPITHLVVSRLMQLHELTCDRRSIRTAHSVWGTSPKLYGETILQIASHPASIQASSPITRAPLTIGFVSKHHSLRERILMLTRKDSRGNIWHRGLAGLMLAMLLLIGFTAAQERSPVIQDSENVNKSADDSSSEQLFLIDMFRIYRGTRKAGDQVAEALRIKDQPDRDNLPREISELDCESFEKFGFSMIGSPKLLVKSGNFAEVMLGGEIPDKTDGEMSYKAFGFYARVELHDRRMFQNQLHANVKLSDNYPFPIYSQDEFREIQASIATEPGKLFVVRLDSRGPIALGGLGDRDLCDITTYVVMRVNPQPLGQDPANFDFERNAKRLESQSKIGEPFPCMLEMNRGESKKFLNGDSKPQVVMTDPGVAAVRYGQCDFEVIAQNPGVVEVSIPRKNCPPENVRIKVTDGGFESGESDEKQQSVPMESAPPNSSTDSVSVSHRELNPGQVMRIKSEFPVEEVTIECPDFLDIYFISENELNVEGLKVGASHLDLTSGDGSKTSRFEFRVKEREASPTNPNPPESKSSTSERNADCLLDLTLIQVNGDALHKLKEVFSLGDQHSRKWWINSDVPRNNALKSFEDLAQQQGSKILFAQTHSMLENRGFELDSALNISNAVDVQAGTNTAAWILSSRFQLGLANSSGVRDIHNQTRLRNDSGKVIRRANLGFTCDYEKSCLLVWKLDENESGGYALLISPRQPDANPGK